MLLTLAVKVRSRRVLLVVLALLVAGIPIGLGAAKGIQAQALADKQWIDLNTRGTLRVGIDPGYRPYSFYDGSGWTGMDADIIGEVARRLHLQTLPVAVGYDSLYDSLHLWQVDAVISAIVANPAETGEFSYSTSYYDAGQVLLSNENHAITTTEQLSNKRVIVALGSDSDRLARFWQRRVANMSRLEAADDVQAFTMLQSDRADAMITTGLAAAKFRQIAPHTIVAILVSQPYVIALRKDNPILLRHMNEALSAMRSDGTLQHIVDKWTDQ